MKRKNNGKNLLVDHSEPASNIFPVRIMVVDSDQEYLDEHVKILQKLPQKYKVTKCDKTDQAFNWLGTKGSEFDIILVGECLHADNKSKLLQIGNARDLPVLVTSKDGGIDTVTRTIDAGATIYLPKPVPDAVLELVWTHVYSKKLAQGQKLTDDASGEKKPRLKWTGLLKEKADECINQAGGIYEAKPNDILQRLRAKGIRDNFITRDKVSSHLQKEREKAINNSEGTIEGSTLKTESNQPTGGQHSAGESFDDIYNGLVSLENGVNLDDSSLASNKSYPTGMFENCTEDNDIARDRSNYPIDDLTMEKISEKIQSQMPGYKDKEGTSSKHVESRYVMEEHPPMTLPHLNTTNPNQLCINFVPVNVLEGFDSIDMSGILEDPNLSLPNECRPVDIIENYTGNDIAHEHSGHLLVDDNFSVENYSVDTIVILEDEDPSLSLSNESRPVGIFENSTENDIARVHSENLVVDDNNFLVDDNNFLVDDDALMPPAADLPES